MKKIFAAWMKDVFEAGDTLEEYRLRFGTENLEHTYEGTFTGEVFLTIYLLVDPHDDADHDE